MARPDATVGALADDLWLAAIGKHPGWNDHLDDIGIEDQTRLVSLKTAVYVGGIQGVINSGTWEELSEEEREPGYAHSFFWRAPDGMVVGRMWSSTDGKGRSKYPMIVASMCRGFPLAFLAGPVLERIKRLEGVCKQETTAAGVITAMDRTRAELRELAGFAPVVPSGAIEAEPAPAVLADAEETLGPDGRGVLRVLYELEQYWRAYLRRTEGDKTGSRSRSVEVRPRHMRVPGVLDSVGADWSVWCRLLLKRVDELAPMLFITRDDRPWVDVIVGDPAPSQMSCLQRSLKSLPYTTDIDYCIDEQTEAFGTGLIASARAGEIEEHDPAFIDAPEERLAQFMGRGSGGGTGSGEGSNRNIMIAVGAAALVLVLIVVAVIVFGGGGGGSSRGSGEDADRERPGGQGERSAEVEPPAQRSDEEPERRRREPAVAQDDGGRGDGGGGASESPRSPSAADADSDRHLAAFLTWCSRARDWYLPFVSALEDSRGRGGPLRERVLAEIEHARAGGLRVNPLDVAGDLYSSIDRMIEAPPRSARKGEFDAQAAAAIDHIDRVRAMISAEGWATRRTLADVSDRLAAPGGSPPAVLRGLSRRLGSDDGASAAEAVLELADAEPVLTALSSRLRELGELDARIRSAGAAAQADCFAALPRVPGGLGGAAEIGPWAGPVRARLDDLVAFGAEIEQGASERLATIDKARYAEELAKQGGCDGEEGLRDWLRLVNRPELHPLDPEEDPRVGLPAEEASAALRARIDSLDRDGVSVAGALSVRLNKYTADRARLVALGWNLDTQPAVVNGTAELEGFYQSLAGDVTEAEHQSTLQADEYIAKQLSQASITTTGSAAINAMWAEARDRAIAAFEASPQLTPLVDAIGHARSTAARLEERFAPVTVDFTVFGPAAEDVRSLLDTARETRLRAVGLNADDSAESAEADAYAAWAAGVERASRTAASVRSMMESWGPFAGGSFEEALAGWRSSWLGERVAIGEVEPRAGLIEAGVLGADRSSLAAMLADSSTPAPAAYLAWRRLGETAMNWPSGIDEFRADGVAVSRLLGEAGSLPGDRGDEVVTELRAGQADRWLVLARGVSDWNGFRDASRAASEAGIDPGSLAPECGYNLLVAGLKNRVASGATIDAENVLAEVGRLLEAGSGVTDADAAGWLRGVTEAMRAREGREIDYTTMGPARAGWEVVKYNSGRRLRYTRSLPNGGSLELGFQLIEGAPTGPCYVAETETPAEILYDFALEGPHAEAVLGVMQPDWKPDTFNPRPGPCVWTWGSSLDGGRGIRAGHNWIRAMVGRAATYAPGIADGIGSPSPEHPLQRVSPHAASLIAALLGCRLPTAAEWDAVLTHIGRPSDLERWNLRDTTFEIQQGYLGELGNRRTPWPDLGIFLPDSPAFPANESAESHTWFDGSLWFDEVEPGGDRAFRHLIGNVAEYVLSSAGNSAMYTDRTPSPADAIAQLDSGVTVPGTFGVIGGSALSPPGLAVDRPAALEFKKERRAGYADVGFRLAFSPSEKPLSAVLEEKLVVAPYLRID